MLLCLILCTFYSLHSQNFNYQAAIRDNTGVLISNQSVGVQIDLLQGGPTGTTIYTEAHTVTTNAFGVVSLAIGTGSTTDTFTSIDWSTQNYWMEVAVDVTGGADYMVIGSSQILNVPYANHATTSGDKALSTTANITSNEPGDIATDDFVFGSTQLANDTNTTDDDVRLFFDKSKGAFRAGFAEGVEWNDTNVGDRSVAFGTKNTVSSFQSFAMGTQNTVSGPTSATFGANNNITGIGTFSTGENLTAEARSQVTIGYLNTAKAGNALIKVPTDRLLVIGNGFDEMSRSDALVMLKNGNTTLNGQLTIDGDNQGAGTSYTLPAQDGTTNQILATNGSGITSWVNGPTIPVNTFSTTANITSNANGTVTTDDFVFGSTQLNDDGVINSGTESRLYFDKSKSAFRVGSSKDINGEEGIWDTAIVGDFSVAMGRGSFAQGLAATALGSYNSVGGENAFAVGHNNLASRPSSMALGTNNNVSGAYAVGLGLGSQATSYAQQTIGLFSDGFASTSHNTYVPTDPLFVIGNGSSDITRSNALVMTKNGNTTLNGQLTIDADNTGAGVGYTFPAQDGTANQVMSTDGSGAVSWVNAASGGAFSTTSNVTSNGVGTIATDDFVFGSTQLDNDTNTTDDDRRMFFDKSKAAFRAGYVETDEWNTANVGDYSAAFGFDNTSSGRASFTAGDENLAVNIGSIAIGDTNYSNAIGSIAIGYGTNASSMGQISLGIGNTSVTGNLSAYVPTDRLFVIGNGFATTPSPTRSDALVMLKNGNTTLNGELTIDGDNQGAGTSYTLPAQDGTVNQVMSTNGSGAVSWVNVPSDGDSDPTNEIELPVQTGQSGKLLTTNGTSTSWTSNVSASSITTDALTVNNLPAFSADLNGTQVLSGAGNYPSIGNWRTSDPSLPGFLYDNGNHFNEATGQFTAPVDGFYYFSAHIRVDDITSGWIRMLFAVNGSTSLNSGMHAIADGEDGDRFQTLNLGGVLKLNANDTVTVVIHSAIDTAWSISDESGFNGYLISRL